jgi:hypothetical protein
MKSNQHRAINEDRFVSRPANAVRAIVPAHTRSRCIADLSSFGFHDSAVHLLEGDEGCRILDVSGHHHGIRGRIVRMFQSGGAEGNELKTMDAALHHGSSVVTVAVGNADQMLLAARTLLDCEGERIFHYDKTGSQLLA